MFTLKKQTLVRTHFSFNAFSILKDILTIVQASNLSFSTLLRETPRDGGRDEEIRLNRIWLETRHTPQTLFLYRTPISLAIAVIFHVRSPVKSSRVHEPRTYGSSSVDDSGGHFSFDRSSLAPIFPRARKRSENRHLADSTFLRSIAIGADIQDKDRPACFAARKLWTSVISPAEQDAPRPWDSVAERLLDAGSSW